MARRRCVDKRRPSRRISTAPMSVLADETYVLGDIAETLRGVSTPKAIELLRKVAERFGFDLVKRPRKVR